MKYHGRPREKVSKAASHYGMTVDWIRSNSDVDSVQRVGAQPPQTDEYALLGTGESPAKDSTAGENGRTQKT
jgi:hypothetical protein